MIQKRTLFATATLLAVVAFSSEAARSEVKVTQAPAAIELKIPTGLPQQFSIAVPIGQTQATLNLSRHSIRSADFQVVFQEKDGPRVAPIADEPRTYRGTVANQQGSAVSASLLPDGLLAKVIMPDGSSWTIEPAPSGKHQVLSDEHDTDEWTCPVENVAVTPALPGAPRGETPTCTPLLAQIAMVADFEFWSIHGGNTTAQLEAYVDNISMMYEEQLGIAYEITQILIWSGGNPISVTPDMNGEIDSALLLPAFRDWYNLNHAGVNRDFAHLVSAQDFVGGNVGRAYIGVPCNLSFGYGVNQLTASFRRSSKTLAHEIGHNWGGNHCNGDPDCDIMTSGNSALGGTTFGSSATTEMIGAGAPLLSCMSLPTITADCNLNGLCDATEISMGTAADVDGNNVPDECERIHNITQDIKYTRIVLAMLDANAGDEIVVAPGTYSESVDDYGKGVTLRSSGGANVTTIDAGGLGGATVRLEGSTLDGFTITGGSTGFFSNAGGGIEVISGTATIIDCIVRNNTIPAGNFGGGAFFNGGTSVTVSGSTFCENSPSNIVGGYTNGGGNSFPSPCPVVGCPGTAGDVNGDTMINGGDIQSFSECYVTGTSSGGDCTCADIVTDGVVNNADVAAFVALLTAP